MLQLHFERFVFHLILTLTFLKFLNNPLNVLKFCRIIKIIFLQIAGVILFCVTHISHNKPVILKTNSDL